MKSALDLARKTGERGEVPVGAVIVLNNKIIAEGYNRRETAGDVTCHAEMEAIRAACGVIGDWRLNDCDLYVTLEPCPMCAGAIIAARVRRLYFGAYDRLYGAMGGRFDLTVLMDAGGLEVYGGIMEAECGELVREFFEGNRNVNKGNRE